MSKLLKQRGLSVPPPVKPEANQELPPMLGTRRTAPGQMIAFQNVKEDWDKERQQLIQNQEEALKALEALKATVDPDEVAARIEKAKAEAEAALAERTRELEEKMKEGGVVMAPISKLKKIPGRQRNLTAEEKKELRDNMASMGRIITPIVVEPEVDGVYAIIAGNNRFDNAVELGWETLPIFVFNGEPEENEDAAFYSNLMHPSLPDYEKYLGLKKIMARDGKSQSELVKLTGLSAPAISRLMAFDKLPADHREIIAQYPERFSGTAVSAFVSAVAKNPVAAKTAIEQIVSAEIAPTQQEIAQIIKKTAVQVAEKPATEKKKITERVFKAKQVIVAKMRSAETFIRVDVPDDTHRRRIEAAIEKAIREITEK